MAQDLRPGRKKAMVLEDAELRSLRIPSTAHRGSLSPSKHSYLPTLQEQAREDRPQSIASRKGATEAPVEAEKKGGHASPETHVLTDLSADVLENVKAEFVENGGALNGEQFVRAMLRNLDGGSGKSQVSTTQESASPMRSASIRAAAVMDLFSHVDVHGESSVTWEDVSNYFIEQGMSGGDEFTVDSIKTYEVSQVKDVSKHETPVEKLVYLEQIDSLVCLSRGSRNFRLYDPKRCILKDTVPGHRGTVINCCYVDAWSQIATTAADMTICFWDSHLQLRNRLAAKDVQLCLQWDSVSRSLFSGAIDGTLSRWDLNNMTLADLRKGNHKKAINDLLMVHDINLLASASSDGSILMWDTTMMKPKKTFKGHKKGTFSLAYSMDYHCLLTAGLDQEALVWNPYVERVPIFRLKGHTHALCGVSIVPGTPQILSADVAGTFRLWDMRSFRCVQSFGGNETTLNDLNTFCIMPPHHRLAAGASRVILHDYMDEWGGESVTDTGGVTDALYNPTVGEFYTISKQTVKTWNANTGVLFKVLRDITQDEITAACVADNGRKIYLGDAKGRVQSHGLQNGAVLSVFDQHPTDISCLSIWKVDVRGCEEQAVSMIPGAVTKEFFEAEVLPQLRAQTSQAAPLVVPYCTVGYRSGIYAKELVEQHGLQNVRNGEGVIMWTFDGNGLVQPPAGPSGSAGPVTRSEALGRSVTDDSVAEQAALQNETRRVHVFGKPWDMAAEGYTTEYFTPAGGAFRFVKQKCSKSGPKAFPWFTEFLLFYLFFTPACGVMYNCGCRVALSKFGQVSSCNIYWPDQPLEHKCPWCTCQGVVCIFVASDTKAFRGVTLLDMLPDGFVVTVLTVLVLHFLFKNVDQCLRPRNFGDSFIAAVKTAIAVSWFVVYCLAFGALFFAGNTSYPHFLGYSRV